MDNRSCVGTKLEDDKMERRFLGRGESQGVLDDRSLEVDQEVCLRFNVSQ